MVVKKVGENKLDNVDTLIGNEKKSVQNVDNCEFGGCREFAKQLNGFHWSNYDLLKWDLFARFACH